jgi:hypothetical protein
MHSQAYSVNSIPFFQDGKALKEGSVTVAIPNPADGSVTHGNGSLVSLYAQGNLHFPLYHFWDQQADGHENFFELFSVGYLRREASDYVVSVRDMRVHSWANVTNGLVHVRLSSDVSDDQGKFQLCDVGRYRIERDDGDLINLRVPEDSPCNPKQSSWYLFLYLSDSTSQDDLVEVQANVEWVLFLRPEAERGRCGFLPKSGVQGASAYHHSAPGIGWSRGGGVVEDEEASDRNRLEWPLGEGVGFKAVPSLACDDEGEFYVRGGSCMAQEHSVAFAVNTSSVLYDTLIPILLSNPEFVHTT